MYSTTIGKLTLPHFIYNASGVWDTTTGQCIQLQDTEYCGATITKSFTLNERTGNSYPKYHFSDPGFSINSNGLENLGLKHYLYNVTPYNEYPLFFSMADISTAANLITRIHNWFNSGKETVGIELNLSCPNIGSPGAAYRADSLEEALRKIFESTGHIELTFGLKLPPYYLPEEFAAVGNVIGNFQKQIDFVTCINSIPNGLDFDIDNNVPVISPNGGYGGIGGPALLPVGLANVNRFAQFFRENNIEVAVVGCGGIRSGADAYKYLLAGASAVQVGTHLWKNGPKIFKEISQEFSQIMDRKGYDDLTDIPRH